MKLIPAIDLKDNKCVRLTQGKDDSSIIYNENPIDQAIFFEKQGCERIHLVDLDAAFGRPNINKQTIINIRNSVTIPLQLGGGIRSREDVNFWFKNNINFIIVGSLAATNNTLIKEIAHEFENRIYISLDILYDKVMISGWEEKSEFQINNFIHTYKESNISGYIVTDVSRDGTMKGIDINFIESKISLTQKKIIFSGGISSYSDLQQLNKIKNKNKNFEGIIIGKAFYSGVLDINKAKETLNNNA